MVNRARTRYAPVRFPFRPFRPSRSLVACTLLLGPMGVGVEIPSDSSDATPVESQASEVKTTSLRFGAGGGVSGQTVHAQRVILLGYSDCGGEPINETFDADFHFKDEYRDYGGELDIQLSETAHLGLRGGWVEETVSYLGSTLDPAVVDTLFQGFRFDDSSTYLYFNPFFSAEHPEWGIGAGFIVSDGRLLTNDRKEYNELDDVTFFPTGHVRLGSLRTLYFNASLWESVPIYSGGGMFTLGIGLRPVAPLEIWGGMSDGGPYSNGYFLARANADLGRRLTLGAAVRLKSDVDEVYQPVFSEHGLSFSLTYKFLRE